MKKNAAKSLLLLLCLPGVALAQGSVSPPGTKILLVNTAALPPEVNEADEYSLDVQENRWDFTAELDMPHFENYQNNPTHVSAVGVWSGVSQNGNGQSQNPLDTGILLPLFSGLAEESSGKKTGDLSRMYFGSERPVVPSKYSLLSYSLAQAGRTEFEIRWEGETSGGIFPGASSSFARQFDGFSFPPNIAAQNYQGWRIYSFDLKNLTAEFSAPLGSFSGSWDDGSGSVWTKLMIRPTTGAASGAQTSLDWIRLSDPNTGTPITLVWSYALTPATNDIVTIVVDSDPAGFNGTPIGEVPALAATSYQINTAIFPPGEYYFYVVLHPAPSSVFGGGADGSLGTLPPVAEVSGYSPAVRVRSKPEGRFLAPSFTSGTDYATVVRNDPWDMNSLFDVNNAVSPFWPPGLVNFINPFISLTPEAVDAGAVFQATTNMPAGSTPGGDRGESPLVFVSTDPLQPIDPRQYRYVTYRLRADPSFAPAPYQKILGGWSSFAVFGNFANFADVGRSPAVPVFSQWQTYALDLGAAPLSDGGIPWMSSLRLGNLGIVPLSPVEQTDFQVDYLRLHAENRPVGNVYNLDFIISDADSSPLTVNLYYDFDNTGFDGIFIASLSGIAPGRHNYLWDLSAFPAEQLLYPYLEVLDGTHAAGTRRYAEAPVRTGKFQALYPGKAPLDYDGDGISDRSVFRRSERRYYQDRSGSGLVYVYWGVDPSLQYFPLDADFDGDGLTDHALVFEWFGNLGWYLHHSATNTAEGLLWGLINDQIAVGDYNRSAGDEVAVFREGQWFILAEDGQVQTFSWGLPGDIPVPDDYDGDGFSDLAVWRPSSGTWYILSSNRAADGSEQGVVPVSYQWGLPGDIPLVGDFDGNGAADLAVWRPSEGRWYLLLVSSGEVRVLPWGLPGDIPVVGDFNGDRISDLTVYRPNTGEWYHYFPEFRFAVRSFGLPGDLVPRRYGALQFVAAPSAAGGSSSSKKQKKKKRKKKRR